jgi:hypothetical protein
MVLVHGNMHYVVLVDDVQTLMSLNDCTLISMRQQYSTYGICEDRSTTDCIDTNQRKFPTSQV